MSEAVANDQPFWLTGNFAPTLDEVTDNKLKVTGKIPEELNGRYFRNGANPKHGDTPHWFLGDGMIHGVELSNGSANWYRNRWVKTPVLDAVDSDAMASMGDLTQSLANTHIVGHAGKILALEEGHWPFELSKDLETIGPHNYDSKLTTGMTAHPKICPATGEMLFFGYGVMPPYLTYHRVSAAGELVQSEPIEVPGATMVHDFNITRNHVIFMDLPLVFNFENMAAGIPIQWSDDYGARLGVMPRNGSNGDVVWYDIDPCYVYHPLNAYEDGDDIVIEVCRMAHSMKPNSPEVPPMMHRWTIHTKTGSVTETQVDDRSVDFPRVPDSLIGLRHRYGYTAEFGSGLPYASTFRKYDMNSGNSVGHHLREGCMGGEPVFVPAADAGSEDEGYLLSYVYDQKNRTSELVVVDAGTMDDEPVARIHIPARIPAGFHGSWIADD